MTMTPIPTRDPDADFSTFRARYGTPSPLQPSRTTAPARISRRVLAACTAVALILIGYLAPENASEPAAIPPRMPPAEAVALPPAEHAAPAKTVAVVAEPAKLSARVVSPPVAHVDFPWLVTTGNGEPVTWPCGPIGYRVVSENAPAGVDDLVAESTNRISVVSGYQFRRDPPLQHVAERMIPYNGITIAWVPRAEFRTDSPTAIGYGGASGKDTNFTTGYVDVLAEWPGAHQADFTANGAGRLLLHELGHALGLNHIDDQSAVMFPVNQGVSVWSPAEQKALQYLRQKCG